PSSAPLQHPPSLPPRRSSVLLPPQRHRPPHPAAPRAALRHPAPRRAPHAQTRPGPPDPHHRRGLLPPHALRLARQRPPARKRDRSEEHTSELQSREKLVCRLL